jgi:hypothetical protein
MKKTLILFNGLNKNIYQKKLHYEANIAIKNIHGKDFQNS